MPGETYSRRGSCASSLARHRLLDQYADLGDAALRDQLGQKSSSSVERSHRQREPSDPAKFSDPVIVSAGTLNRSSIAVFVGSALSEIAGPKIATQPSSTSSP